MEIASIQKLNPAGNGVYNASYGDDSGLYVEFYMREVEDEKASKEQGRPIYVSKPYIKIISIGNKNTQQDRPVRHRQSGQIPPDTVRFPKQWAAFSNQQEQVIEGTPITEWAALPRAEAMSLKAMNIHTVEKLANLGDNNINWMGGRQLRDKAQAWLKSASDGSVVIKQQQLIDELKIQIDALKNQMEGFSKAVKPVENTDDTDLPSASAASRR